MKKIFLILPILVFLLKPVCSGQNANFFLSEPLNISAEEMTYNQDSGELQAVGNVAITQSSITVKADRIMVNLEKGDVLAEGNARITEDKNDIQGEKINYNFSSSTGVIFQARGDIGGWFFSAPFLERKSPDKYSGRNSSLSNCDKPLSHWHLSSTNLSLELNKKIVVYNSLVYLGKIPVFYLPYYSRGLGESRLNIVVYPSYNAIDGLIVRTNTSWQFSPQLQGNILLDYFTQRGWGTGTRWDYNKENFQGTFYGYQIEEKNTGLNRWTMRSLIWNGFSSGYNLRMDLNRQSDLTVNNYYFLENWQRSIVSPYSEISLTRQKNKISWRLLAGEYWDYDYSLQKYVRTKYILPSLQFRALGINPLEQVYLNYNTLLEKSFFNAGGHSLNLNQDIIFWRSVILGRDTTLTPSWGWQNNWLWEMSKTTTTSVNRHLAKLNLRQNFSPYLWLDLTYSFRQRFKPNHPEIAFADDDYGTEENILSGQLNYFELLPGLNFRSYLGYDWREFRSYIPAEKFTLWRNEFNWQKNHLWFYWNNQTNLYHLHNQNWQFSGGVGQKEQQYASMSVFNQGDNCWGINLSAGMWLNKFYVDWRTTKVFLDQNPDWLNWPDNQFRIYWDMHCWQTRFSIIQRPDYYDFKIDLSLKMPGGEKKVKVNENFYPWE